MLYRSFVANDDIREIYSINMFLLIVSVVVKID